MSRCHLLYDALELVAVDKAEGVLSHPNQAKGGGRGAERERCAFEGKYDFDERSFETPEGTIWLIHRLDQDTSGVLLAARSRVMAQKLRTLFEEDRIQKHYTALTAGRVTPLTGKWYDSIEVDRQKGKVRSRIVRSGSPNAKLRYTVERFYSRQLLSFLSVELLTGKTHQIRVQSASRHHPVAGDEIYGNFPLNKVLKRELGLRRLFLHASALEFKHPATDEPLRLEAPLPLKLRSVLEILKGGHASHSIGKT